MAGIDDNRGDAREARGRPSMAPRAFGARGGRRISQIPPKSLVAGIDDIMGNARKAGGRPSMALAPAALGGAAEFEEMFGGEIPKFFQSPLISQPAGGCPAGVPGSPPQGGGAVVGSVR